MEKAKRVTIEKTLVFVKPGNLEKASEILACLDDLLNYDFTHLEPIKITQIPDNLIREHYNNIQGQPFYEATIKAFLEQGVVLTVYGGGDIVKRIREIVGDTDPKKAKPGTIRSKFGHDSLEVAFREKRYLNNVIHASESLEDAKREIEIWKTYLTQ